jgi:hypothetical protein
MPQTRAHGEVVAILQEASSQDAARIKPAEKLLAQWEGAPGFYSILQVG